MAYSSKNPKNNTEILKDQAATAVSSAPSGAHTLINRNGKLWMKDSSGTEVQVGSASSIGKNYIGNPSAAADTTGATASGAGITVARSTTAAELPRDITTATGYKITPVSGTDYVRWRWTADRADYTRKLGVVLAMAPVAGYASGDLKLDVYATTDSSYATGLTRVTLPTDVSSVTALPNYTGPFQTSFDGVSTTAIYYELRITRVAGTTAIVISDLTVGPGVVTQGAANGPWTSYTPTTQGFSATVVANVVAWYRRVGDTMEISGRFDSATPQASEARLYLPTGFTGVSTASGAGDGLIKGKWWRGINTATTRKQGTLYLNTTAAAGGYLLYGSDDYNATAYPNVAMLGNSICGSSETQLFHVTGIPIAEWAGSGVVNLASPGTANASVSCNTGNGHGATNTKIRRFTNSTTTGVAITYADSSTLGGTFTINEAGLYSISYTDARTAGAGALGISLNSAQLTTTIDSITVANRLLWANTPGAAGYGVATWSGRLAAGDVIRAHTDGLPDGTGDKVQLVIAKIADNAGQAVGFAEVAPGTSAGLVSASGLKGNTGSAAVAAGYVGEVKSSTTTTAVYSASSTFENVTSLPMTAGTWWVSGALTQEFNNSTTPTNLNLYISGYTGNSTSDQTIPLNNVRAAATQTNSSDQTLTLMVPVRCDGTNLYIGSYTIVGTTLYLKSLITYSGTAPKRYGSIVAVRVA